jgi:hypothetical protein
MGGPVALLGMVALLGKIAVLCKITILSKITVLGKTIIHGEFTILGKVSRLGVGGNCYPSLFVLVLQDPKFFKFLNFLGKNLEVKIVDGPEEVVPVEVVCHHHFVTILM